MTFRRLSVFAAALAVVGGVLPLSWGQEDDLTISVDVDVVNVLATVRDKKGRLVNDLDQEDFILKEDGERQTIRYFTRQTDLPLTIGLLVDTSVSQERIIEPQRQGAFQFFEQVLRNKKDLAFLISFDVDIELLQDLTDSRALLHEALGRLRVQGSRGGLHPGPVPTQRRPVGTALFDAVYLASEEVMKHQVGRKALILISDGNDYGSRIEQDEAIAAAHRADAVIYGIRYFDRGFYYRAGGLSGGGGRSTLKKLASETGGGLFEVKKKKPLEEIFGQIQDELRSQYSIGYSSTADPSRGGFRRIALETTHKNLEVQTRSGYYAKSP